MFFNIKVAANAKNSPSREARLRLLQHKKQQPTPKTPLAGGEAEAVTTQKAATNAEGSLAGGEAEGVTKVKSFNQCRRFFTGFSVNNRSENV
jgi:hypothetical protein